MVFSIQIVWRVLQCNPYCLFWISTFHDNSCKLIHKKMSLENLPHWHEISYDTKYNTWCRASMNKMYMRTRKTQGRHKVGKKGGESGGESGGERWGREGEDWFALILLHWHGCHWVASNGVGININQRWKMRDLLPSFGFFSSIKSRFNDVALFNFFFFVNIWDAT